MSRIRRALAGLMAAVCFLATPGWGTDAVLCFGGDGHVAVELAQDGECGSGPWGLVGLPAGLLNASAIQCDPCLDVPFSQQPAMAKSSSPNGHKSLRPAPKESTAASGLTVLPNVSCLFAGRPPTVESSSKILPLRLTCVLQI
jgi:hypothetical protein